MRNQPKNHLSGFATYLDSAPIACFDEQFGSGYRRSI
jgi:hypothetical protein